MDAESSTRKIKEFFEHFRLLNYKKGEIILRPFEQTPGVYYLKSGYVRLYSMSEDGQELSLIIFKPGDFFPIIWLINNTQNKYYIDSLTSCELMLVPKNQFLEFIHKDSDVLFEITSRALVRLGGLLERMEYLVYGNAGQKLASILLICAERFGREEGNEIIIPVPLTHRDVANLLGLARETASIEIKRLERKNLIAYRGRYLMVKDMSKLKKESILTS